MSFESVIEYIESKADATASFPFGEGTLVYKTNGKMFALISCDEVPFKMNLKALPENCEQWREDFPDSILPGYHMNKIHWNTIIPEHSDLKMKFIKEMIDHSYDLIANSKKKK